LYDNQGRYDEALPLYQRSLAILEKSLGSKHPTTKTVALNYAATKKLANQSPNRPKKKTSRRSK
jgi:hypothetical protein